MMTVCFILLLSCALTLAMARLVRSADSDLKDRKIVTLQLGTDIEEFNLNDGHGIYFDCTGRPSPEIQQLPRFSEGNEVNHNPTPKIMSGAEGLAMLLRMAKNATENFACSVVISAKKPTEIKHDHLRIKRNIVTELSQVSAVRSSSLHRMSASKQVRHKRHDDEDPDCTHYLYEVQHACKYECVKKEE